MPQLDLVSMSSLSLTPALVPGHEKCPVQSGLAPSLPMWLLDVQIWRDNMQRCLRHSKAKAKGIFAVTFATLGGHLGHREGVRGPAHTKDSHFLMQSGLMLVAWGKVC